MHPHPSTVGVVGSNTKMVPWAWRLACVNAVEGSNPVWQDGRADDFTVRCPRYLTRSSHPTGRAASTLDGCAPIQPGVLRSRSLHELPLWNFEIGIEGGLQHPCGQPDRGDNQY